MDIKNEKTATEEKQILTSSFFSSLSPEQKKQYTIIVGEQLRKVKVYRDFKRNFLSNGFVLFLWEIRLWHEIIEPTKINTSMWRLLMFIWALKHTDRFKNDEPITRKIIFQEIGTMGRVFRLWPSRNLIALVKYGWLNVQSGAWNTKRYYLTEQSLNLIKTYAIAYSRCADEFFNAPH